MGALLPSLQITAFAYWSLTLHEQASQLRVFRDGVACLRTDPARPFFAAGFFAFRVKPFADFVTAFRFGVDFFAAALAGARLFAADIFAFVPRLVGRLLARLFRAAITAPDTAPINVPTTGVPIAVPTTAPATAPPRVLLAAPLSSLDRIAFLSLSSLMILPPVHLGPVPYNQAAAIDGLKSATRPLPERLA